MATFGGTTEPFQFCPECRGRSAATGDGCWRCGGRGIVDPYDPLEPRYVARIYFSGSLGGRIDDLRTRVSLHELEPEVTI